MLNALIDGVVSAIDAEFGEGYPIHTDTVDQGLVEPCFTVRIVKPIISQFLGKRYLNKNLVSVQYFPSVYGDNAEINDVISRLYSILEIISVSGVPTRGTDAEPHVEDGVLIFTINYDYFTIQVTDEDPLEDIIVKGGLQ